MFQGSAYVQTYIFMTMELFWKVFLQRIRNQLAKSESTVKLKPKMSRSKMDRVKFIQDFQTEV